MQDENVQVSKHFLNIDMTGGVPCACVLNWSICLAVRNGSVAKR